MWKEEYLKTAKEILGKERGVAHPDRLEVVTENVKIQGGDVVLVEDVHCYTQGVWGNGKSLESTPPKEH